MLGLDHPVKALTYTSPYFFQGLSTLGGYCHKSSQANPHSLERPSFVACTPSPLCQVPQATPINPNHARLCIRSGRDAGLLRGS